MHTKLLDVSYYYYQYSKLVVFRESFKAAPRKPDCRVCNLALAPIAILKLERPLLPLCESNPIPNYAQTPGADRLALVPFSTCLTRALFILFVGHSVPQHHAGTVRRQMCAGRHKQSKQGHHSNSLADYDSAAKWRRGDTQTFAESLLLCCISSTEWRVPNFHGALCA